MNVKKRVTTFFMMIALFVISGGSKAAEDFFLSGPDCGAGLPVDKIFPAGLIFPYAGFSPKSLGGTKRKDFTLAGPAVNAFSGEKADAPVNGILKLQFTPYEVKGIVFFSAGK